jgi:hypothetical protein
MQRVAAAAATLLVCLNSNAQELQTVQLQGKDSSWRLVGSVEPMTGFQIGAKGMVDFGGIGNDDGVTAGVTGNAFVKWCRDNWDSIENALEQVAQVVVAVSSSALTTSSSGLSVMHWNWVDYINHNGPEVNYDEGGFFVVVTTDDQPPSKSNVGNQAAKPALYYWYNKLYNGGNTIGYDKKVWVWVKQHDGGRDAYSTKDFGDNHGTYTIWIDLDNKITDNDLNTSSVPASSKKLAAVGGVGTTESALTSSGKAHHTSTVLKRKTPNNHPH